MMRFLRKEYRKEILIVGLALCAFGLGGCYNVLVGAAAMKFYNAEDVNLVESSYAAADYILQKSNTYYDRYTPIRVVPLIDAERTDLSSRLGRVVSNQVGSRFGQLGYNVDLSRTNLQDGDGEFQAQPSRQKPKIAISGTYKRQRPEMEINLYITEVETGYRIATFQYFIPYDSDIRKMSEPEIRMIQVR